jgi:hypothetical protein
VGPIGPPDGPVGPVEPVAPNKTVDCKSQPIPFHTHVLPP